MALLRAAGGINLPPAWDKSTGTGVVVAVIDTGYRPHVDLAANILPGYDIINDTSSPTTAMAATPTPRTRATGSAPASAGRASLPGSAAAGTARTSPAPSPRVTNNGSGVAGVAFNAKVLPVRVLGKCGGYTSDIADGIVWASGGRCREFRPTPTRRG